jgi:cytochrome c
MKHIVLAAIFVAAGLGQANAQDATAGEKVFVVCRACHQVGPNAKNAVGPVLNGLFGRKAGSVEGYNYSEANKKSGIAWSEEEFTKYIQDPKGVVPGTKMTFAGIKDPQKIKDLIAYLHTFDHAPVKLKQ